MINMRFYLFGALIILLGGCSVAENEQPPNILWITCEDISPTLSFNDDSTAYTPVLDKLAEESIVFKHVYATVGVCAPARSSIITGMYPASIGTHNMRTGRDYSGWGTRNYDEPSDATDINGDAIPLYSAVVPEQVKCFTEYLRAAGYFCTNNAKTDYQFAAPVTAWDQNGNKAHWRNRAKNQPFFAVFNHEVTHESRIWMNKELPHTVDPATVPLPPYFPDNPVVRQDIARNYSNIELLDSQVGELLKELSDSGLLDNTIIFFFSDHGGPLPRGKREHYDSGLKVPFLVRFPAASRKGRNNELISFVDLAPTVLSLAGIKPPDYIQGKAFLGKYKSSDQRKYIFASSDRFDEHADMIRMVKDDRFLYVRNFYPNRPAYKDVAYRKQMDMMNELLALRDKDLLNTDQAYFFREKKAEEEFYDCLTDTYQLNNLIGEQQYTEKIEELRGALSDWQTVIDDKGFIPELELLESMWPGGIQPKTVEPEYYFNGEMLHVSCDTPGSSIAYIISDNEFKPDLNSGWKLYHQPLRIIKGKTIYLMSTRIGYRDSEIVKTSS